KGGTPAVEQQMFNARADIGTPDKELLLQGERHANHIGVVDLLAQLGLLRQLLDAEGDDAPPGAGDGAEAEAVGFAAAAKLRQKPIQTLSDQVQAEPLVVGAGLRQRGADVLTDAAEAAQKDAGWSLELSRAELAVDLADGFGFGAAGKQPCA